MLFFGLAVLIIEISFLTWRLTSGSHEPYSVAIIGFPTSGKTTLIVSLFQEIFNRKMKGIRATLKGESTIERINEQILKKESGIPVGPTNDQTMFAYRTNIVSEGAIFKKEYKVEFGDYPGEYSEELSEEKYFKTLRRSEFFKWCVEADAYIFIIDVGRFLLEPNKEKFIAESSSAIRESWQHFLDYRSESEIKTRQKPILLVFNKMDLFQVEDFDKEFLVKANLRENELNRIDILKHFGFSLDQTPPIFDLHEGHFMTESGYLNDEFRSLILYLQSEAKHFHILHTSNFGMIDNRFAGVKDILKFILPPNFRF
jgi:GTPase SAR1 family protein